MKICFELNGQRIEIEAPPDRRAVDLLRQDMGLTGTKEGCGTGECGACTILVDGRSRLSCLMLAAQLEGRTVTTIEGLAPEHGPLHQVQQAFVEHGAVQCGFCTPGMVLTAVDLLTRTLNPDAETIRRAISGNLCRCTGYQKIVTAIGDAAGCSHSAGHTPAQPSRPLLKKPARSRAPAKGKRTVALPASLDELWGLLAAHPEARVLAGGSDLLVWLRSRRIDPPVLIGLERIAALHGVVESKEAIRIGAATTHEHLLNHAAIARHVPLLSQALQHLGSPHIRHIGTLGGNIATASPAGDTLPPLYVLDATVELQSAHGTRLIPIGTLITGPGKTLLAPGEIIGAVHIAKPAGSPRYSFEKVGLRRAMACAVASLAAQLRVSANGIINHARLAWGSVGPTVLGLPEVEAALVGRPLTAQSLRAVQPLVMAGLSPISDVRASAGYRRQVAANLLLRLLELNKADIAPTATEATVHE